MVNKGNYVKPWSRQKELQKKYSQDDVPDLEELGNIIDSIKIEHWCKSKFYTERAKALFALYYLTACRASEFLKCRMLRRQAIRKRIHIDELGHKRTIYKVDKDRNKIIDKWLEEHEYKGIRKKDIKIKRIDERLCMLIRTENRKHKKRTSKRQPIPIELEKEIANYVIKFAMKAGGWGYLFKFGTKRATQIINDTTGFNLHFIRHIRATHLVTLYDFNEQTLIKFMGWTDGRPAKHYMELKETDVFRQFYKR